MRRLSNEDLRNLHVLMRFFCDEMNFGYSTLADRLTKTMSDPALAEKTYERLVEFINRGTLKGINELLPHFVQTLAMEFEAVPATEKVSFAPFLELVLAGKTETDKDAKEFFSPLLSSNYMVKAMREKAAKKDPQLALLLQVKEGYEQNIGRALGLLSLTADHKGRETTLSEPRLDDQHLVAIRLASAGDATYSVHGLKFQRHWMEESVMFFSAKYFIDASPEQEGGSDAEKNKHQAFGVSFFDGQYLFGVARSTTDPMMTVLTGRLPVGQNIEFFEGFLMTSNSEGFRVNAPVLCLRCGDEDEKYRRMGRYDLKELIEETPEAQRPALDEWLEGKPASPVRL